ncbi:MAG: YihY/virulence factor BrkB family protein, partial [Candidatus Eremiobacterota bacterium]
AAGIAFFAFFSVFPLFMLSLALLTYVLPLENALHYTESLASLYLPEGALRLLESNVRTIASDRGKISLTSLLLLLWSGRQLFRALEVSLHRTWNLPTRRHFLFGNLLSMMLVLLCGAVASTGVLVTIFFSFAQTLMHRWKVPNLGFLSPDNTQFWAAVHSWVVIPCIVTTIFLLLYTMLPSRRVSVSTALPGALFSAAAWKLSSLLYVEYMVWFGRFSTVYTSIWSIVGLLIFLYVEASVFLLGAELVFLYPERPQAPEARRRKAVSLRKLSKKL